MLHLISNCLFHATHQRRHYQTFTATVLSKTLNSKIGHSVVSLCGGQGACCGTNPSASTRTSTPSTARSHRELLCGEQRRGNVPVLVAPNSLRACKPSIKMGPRTYAPIRAASSIKRRNLLMEPILHANAHGPSNPMEIFGTNLNRPFYPRDGMPLSSRGARDMRTRRTS